MATQLQLTNQFGTELLDHLPNDVEIPIVQGSQRQGDVLIRPSKDGEVLLDEVSTAPLIPMAGVPVVRGENGGNTHLLVGEGDVRYLPAKETTATSLILGSLLVGEGSVAYLTHPQHGFMGIGSGTYIVKRQREVSVEEELRIIADQQLAIGSPTGGDEF